MSKLLSRHVFTSEFVSEGHPDKVADQVSDAILDACISADPSSHVACETAVGSGVLMNVGEITIAENAKIPYEEIARKVVAEIGYDRPEEGFSYDTFKYLNYLHEQSQDINMGVSRGSAEEQGAGDQGMMFGYATNVTPELMPAALLYSRKLLQKFSSLRRNSSDFSYLRPDSKAQVSILYDKGRPLAITDVVISHQTEDIPIERIRKDIEAVARQVLAGTDLLTNDTRFHINPTGRFVIGGPCGDSGVTGRKIIVDTYGGVGSHGGGAFSGKDPSKVDRTAAYYCRYAAKNIVASGLAEKCEIQVAYAIGVAAPMSINVSTYGTSKIPEERIADILLNGDIFDFRPGMMVKDLGLLKPEGWNYQMTASFGHFGRDEFPWERTDRIDALREAAK